MNNLELKYAKAGDALLVTSQYMECIEKVKRVTDTLVITEQHKFDRESGREINSSDLCSVYASIANSEDISRVKINILRNQLIFKLNHSVDFSKLEFDKLQKIMTIIEE